MVDFESQIRDNLLTVGDKPTQAMKIALLTCHQRKEEVVLMSDSGKRSAVAPLPSME